MTVFPLLAGLAILVAPVHAFNVYRLGGDGNPWQAALSFQPGEYLIIGPDGAVTGRGALSTLGAYPTWQDTLTHFADSLGGQWMRPFFVPDTLNLAEDGVRQRVARGISDNLLTSDTCYNNKSGSSKMGPMFDGDPTTAAFYTASAASDPEIRRGFYIQNSVVDLGVDYPINRIRFFPRLGKNNPKIDEILEKFAEPRIARETLGDQDFSDNFLPWFEVSGANSINNFAANCYWATNTSPFFQRIEYAENAKSDSRWTILRRDPENLDAVVDLRFPVQQFQWITFRPLNPIENWEVAEFQVFGHGYIARTVYTTAVLDFGEPAAWGKIRWQGARDPNAKVLLRTRSGSDPDPVRYWVPSAIPGELKEITQQEYERASITERSTTPDIDNWSFWSSPYPWESGLADTALATHQWQDGTAILSPGPARYLQLQVIFLSTLEEAGRLQQLEIQFARPSALRVVGEIWPLDVSPTESSTFTYSVRPTLDEVNQGFDRLEIFTLARADTVRSVRVDGEELIDRFAPRIEDDRILVSFPKLQGGKDTFKLIEVQFDTRVVRYGTEFQGWVFDSQANEVKQLVEPGDATVEFPGNALGVRTANPGAELFAAVEVTPNPFTPNRDGINDQIRFQFQLHELSVPRLLSLSIYDLSGRRVRQLEARPVIRGLFGQGLETLSWDGLDDGGVQVPPGVYLYQLSLDTDKGPEKRSGTLSLAY